MYFNHHDCSNAAEQNTKMSVGYNNRRYSFIYSAYVISGQMEALLQATGLVMCLPSGAQAEGAVAP